MHIYHAPTDSRSRYFTALYVGQGGMLNLMELPYDTSLLSDTAQCGFDTDVPLDLFGAFDCDSSAHHAAEERSPTTRCVPHSLCESR